MIPVIDSAIGFARDIFGSIWVNKGDKLKADVAMKEFDTEIQKLKDSGLLEQKIKGYNLAIAEAQHRSVFVAGWRPCIGWICDICLALVWIPQFSLGSYFWIVECIKLNHLVAYPISLSELFSMLGTLITWGGLRSLDKWKGVTK